MQGRGEFVHLQAGCQQKRSTSREIVPVQWRRAILSLYQKHTRAASGNDVRDLPCEERKGRKIRPAGTISHEVMRTSLTSRVLPMASCGIMPLCTQLSLGLRGMVSPRGISIASKSFMPCSRLSLPLLAFLLFSSRSRFSATRHYSPVLGRASFRLALVAVRRIVLSCGLFVPGNCVLCAEHNSHYSLLSTMWPASFRQLG